MALRRHFAYALLAAAMVATTTACGGSDAAEKGSDSLGTITIGLATSPPDLTSHQFYYAKENGFYEKLGLNVEIKVLPDDQTAIRSLIAGDVDVVWSGAAAGISAMSEGADIKAITSTTPTIGFQLVGSSSIKNPVELEGKRLAVSTPGAVSAVTPLIMIKDDGGDPSKAKVVALGGNGARAAALVAKKVDAAMLNEPFTTQMKQYPYLHVIADGGEGIPNFIYCMETVKSSLIEKRRDAVDAFVKGSLEGTKWANSNPELALKISEKVLPDSKSADLKVAIDAYSAKAFWSASGALTKEQWDFTTKALIDNGLLKKAPAFADSFAAEFTK